MAHAGMQCYKHVAKLSQNKEIVLQLLLKLRLTLKSADKEVKNLSQWEKKKKSIVTIRIFSPQNVWGYLILFLLKAHTYNCWSTEAKLLNFKKADHEILANHLVFNSVILVEFAGRNQKTNASDIVSTVTFTTWMRSFNLHSKIGRNLTSLDLAESFNG